MHHDHVRQLRTASRGRPGAMLGISVALCMAGCRNDSPCLSWVEVGESYEVAVIERFEMDASGEGSRRGQYPYSGFEADETSCGDTLGDNPGDGSLSFEVTNLKSWDSHTCAVAQVAAPVPGDRLSDREPRTALLYPIQLDAVIRTDRGCEGDYSLAIVPVLESFLETHPKARSDYMLRRRFLPTEEDPACPPGLMPLEWCTDSYYVRVRDSSGEQISRDLSP